MIYVCSLGKQRTLYQVLPAQHLSGTARLTFRKIIKIMAQQINALGIL